jgi:AraC-like DNA-binding protein
MSDPNANMLMDAPATAWLNALADPRCEFVVPMAGRVTVEPAWAVPQRSLDAHLFYMVLREHMSVEMAGVSRQVGPGGLLWIAPGTGHALSITDAAKPFTVLFLRLALTPRPRRQPPAPHSWVLLDEAWEVEPYLHRIVDEHRHAGGAFRDAIVRGNFLGACAIALRRAREPSHPSSSLLTPAQRHAVEQLADADDTARPTPTDLADAAGLSPDYFARLFQRTYGRSPRAWLVTRRIARAADVLSHTTSSVSEVAQRFGYDDLFLFSRQFKQVTGRSPRAYRGEL